MRKLLSLLSIFAIVLSCSSDETSTPVTPPAPIVKYTITLSAGEGGTVSTTGGEYEAGQTVSVAATPQGEYVFTSWSDGNTNATRTITVSSNSTLTANFEKRKYPLTINFEGEGEVIEEIVNAGRTTEYDSGTTVKLTAQAAAEWVFIGWTGDIESTEESVQIVIGEPKEVTATFEKKKYPLSVNIEGEGEVIEEIVEADRTTDYDSGTTVKLTAEPTDEWLFTGWSGDIGDIDPTENPIQLSIIESKTVTATFEKKKYPLTVNIEGEGEVLEEIVNTGRTTEYGSGTTVKLTAEPADEWLFTGWSGDIGDIDPTENPIQLNIIESKTVKATFEKINITSRDAELYLRDGNSKKTNRLPQFNSMDLEVLYSDNFAIWWDKSTRIDHYADAVDILKWSEISFNKSESYAGNYRPLISKEYYINIYIHHPSYESGEPDGFPDWGQWVGGEDYGGKQGPYVAFPYGTNIIEINEYEPRMNVVHELFHVIDFDRPRRIINGSWWREAIASLFELIIISENPDPNSYYRGKSMGGAPSLVMLPHFSPWFAPNRPNGPGEWDLWSAGIHKYQTSYFLRFISQNSNLSIEDILGLQFKKEGDFRNNYYYFEPFKVLKNLLGVDKFNELFFNYVKAVADLTFLSEYERVGYLRALEDVLKYPIEDKRISLEISSNGEYSPNYKNQALSWTLIKVNGTDFSFEIIPDELGNQGSKAEFLWFLKEENGVTFIYVVNISDKDSGDETFNYNIIVEGL